MCVSRAFDGWTGCPEHHAPDTGTRARLALLDTEIASRCDGERDEPRALVRLAHVQSMQALAQR